MFKFIIIFSTLFIFIVNVGATILGKHNFQRDSWNGGRKCTVCHLGWRKWLPLNTYRTETFDPSKLTNIDSTSYLCHHCHDSKNTHVKGKEDPPLLAGSVSNRIDPNPSSPTRPGGLTGRIDAEVNGKSSNDYKKCSTCHRLHTNKLHLLKEEEIPSD